MAAIPIKHQGIHPRKRKSQVDPLLCHQCEHGLIRPGRKVCPACEERGPADLTVDKELAAWTALALSCRPGRGEEVPVGLAREILSLVRTTTGRQTPRSWDRRAKTAGVTSNSSRQVRVRKRSGELAS